MIYPRLENGTCFQMIWHQLQTNSFQRVLNAMGLVSTAQSQLLRRHLTDPRGGSKIVHTEQSGPSSRPRVKRQHSNILHLKHYGELSRLWGDHTNITFVWSPQQSSEMVRGIGLAVSLYLRVKTEATPMSGASKRLLKKWKIDGKPMKASWKKNYPIFTTKTFPQHFTIPSSACSSCQCYHQRC